MGSVGLANVSNLQSQNGCIVLLMRLMGERTLIPIPFHCIFIKTVKNLRNLVPALSQSVCNSRDRAVLHLSADKLN
jgi:hypothetical protein